VGVGYQPVPKRGVVALGVNWGKPNETSFGDLDGQVTTELFWRYHLTKQLALTPSVQHINNPALNPDTNNMWVVGFRARLVF
jgi:porin